MLEISMALSNGAFLEVCFPSFCPFAPSSILGVMQYNTFCVSVFSHLWQCTNVLVYCIVYFWLSVPYCSLHRYHIDITWYLYIASHDTNQLNNFHALLNCDGTCSYSIFFFFSEITFFYPLQICNFFCLQLFSFSNLVTDQFCCDNTSSDIYRFAAQYVCFFNAKYFEQFWNRKKK